VQRFVPPLDVKAPKENGFGFPLTDVAWVLTPLPVAPIVIVTTFPETLDVELSYVLLAPIVRPLTVPMLPTVIDPVPVPWTGETVIVPGLLGG
jgi:hypothetical protein